MNKTALTIITIGLVIGIGVIFIGGSKGNNDANNISMDLIQNTEIIDGVQYITINAKGGYSPKISSGKAGIPTKLIVKTNGTYDCSAALSVKSVGFQKILPKTGEEIIDLGTPQAGVPIRGVCGMGRYRFLVNFE